MVIRRWLLSTVALVLAGSAFAQADNTPPAPAQAAPASPAPRSAAPAPELVRLDRSLTSARDDKAAGKLDEESYQAFLERLRADLIETMTRVKPTPPNVALHARILARMGDSAQALSTLGTAIKQSPRSPDLRVAAGQVRYDQKDYPAALAEANAALAMDPTNKEALALKHFSEGRTAGISSDIAAPPSNDFARLDWTIPEHNDVPPQTLKLLQQGIDANRRGDRDGARDFIQAAMNASPKSKDVQTIYSVMRESLRRDEETKGYVLNAARAMNAGRGDEAVAWAEKAYARAPGPSTQSVLEQARRDRAALPKATPPKSSAPADDGKRATWPLSGAATGALLMGLVAMFGTRTDEERWRRPLMIASLVGIGALGGGLLGYGAYSMMGGSTLAAGGGGLALASGGAIGAATTAQGGAYAAAAAGGLVGGAASAKAAQESDAKATERTTPPGSGDAPTPEPSPRPGPLPMPGGSLAGQNDCSLKGGEDVLDRFIDGTRLAPGFLPKHEGPGLGHTIEKHVGKTAEYLIARLNQEESASSFDSLPVAEDAIRETVDLNRNDIQDWFRTLGTPKAFERENTAPIGYGVSRNSRVLVRQRTTRVVLLKKEGCRIVVLTAYPR